MRNGFPTGLLGDEAGKGALGLAMASCVIAIAMAAASPAFKASPLVDRTVDAVRAQLPDTFAAITRALGG
jgi:hypothetical protein